MEIVGKRRLLLPGAIVIAAALVACLSRDARRNRHIVAMAEDSVYEAVVRDIVKAANENHLTVTQLVFNRDVLAIECPGPAQEDCDRELRYNLEGKVHQETGDDFFKKSHEKGLLPTTFHTELRRYFVAPTDLYFNDSELAGKTDHRRPFSRSFPGAMWVISFSRVGFDSSLREAIVDTYFDCGFLCWAKERYILRKAGKEWIVIYKMERGLS